MEESLEGAKVRSTTSTSQHLCDGIDELSRVGFERVEKPKDMWIRGTSSRIVIQMSEKESGETYALDCESAELARSRRSNVSQAIAMLKMSDKVAARTDGTKLYVIRL